MEKKSGKKKSSTKATKTIKAEKEVEIVNVALIAMSAMTEANFKLEENVLKYEILLKSKDGFTIVLTTVFKN